MTKNDLLNVQNDSWYFHFTCHAGVVIKNINNKPAQFEFGQILVDCSQSIEILGKKKQESCEKSRKLQNM